MKIRENRSDQGSLYSKRLVKKILLPFCPAILGLVCSWRFSKDVSQPAFGGFQRFIEYFLGSSYFINFPYQLGFDSIVIRHHLLAPPMTYAQTTKCSYENQFEKSFKSAMI
jgi:hypothetical protein